MTPRDLHDVFGEDVSVAGGDPEVFP